MKTLIILVTLACLAAWCVGMFDNDPTPDHIYRGVFYRAQDSLYAFYKDGNGITIIDSGWTAADTLTRRLPRHPHAISMIVRGNHKCWGNWDYSK